MLFASLSIKKQVQNRAQMVLLIPTHLHIALKPKCKSSDIQLYGELCSGTLLKDLLSLFPSIGFLN